jgi:phospholipid transport system substrate-binding protein
MQFTRCRRRGLLTGTAALIVASVLPARAAEADSPVRPIQQLVDGLLRIMKAGTGTPFSQRFEMLAPVIDRSFDVATILGQSIGPSWSSLSPDQQAMLLQAFRRYTVASYVNSFDRYEGQRFEVQPETRAVGNGQQVVMTRIIPKSGDSHELDYVMHQGNGGWRVVDVLADGAVSRVAVQRSDFRRLIARGGPQALASSLSTKSADLSDGTS